MQSVKQTEVLTVSAERDDRCLWVILPAQLKSESFMQLFHSNASSIEI